MRNCIFVSDLHGHIDRYEKLFNAIIKEKPFAVFIGGDITPSYLLKRKHPDSIYQNFIPEYLLKEFQKVQDVLKNSYPQIFIILGNDDARAEEDDIFELEKRGIWYYIHNKKVTLDEYKIFGYSNVPPTPFLLKDWEKYDVSRFTDPGCIPPTEGFRTVKVPEKDIELSTIKNDLENLTGNEDLLKSIFLFHSPPYDTHLDRAALDGKTFDHVPLDVYIGSIAIKNFILERQPYITFHGHVHESTRLTGHWFQKINNTFSFQAAHDGKELSMVSFNLEKPENAVRILI
ncbi:MAG: hypothetical protein ABSG15_03330 [FCB group bacterium]